MIDDMGIFKTTVSVAHPARAIGLVFLYAGGRSTATVAAFAEEDDQVLLGAHGLEGLNLRVDLVSRQLVPAVSLPAASLPA